MKLRAIGCAALLMLALPGAAVAKPSATDRSNAAKNCKSLRAAMGADNFKAQYGTARTNGKNAFGRCVSRQAREEAAELRSARINAAKQCKAEAADPAFADSHEGKTFAEFYGTGKAGRNAHGKCVSTKARELKAETDPADRNKVNAARECRREQRTDATQFAADYGTRRNAFGKCVSKKAREKNDEQQTAPAPAA